MRNAVFVLAVLALLGTQVCISRAQKITGKVEGHVVDEAGKPVAFANVVASSPALQGNRGVMSTSEGYFVLPNLPPGTYTIQFSHVTYQPLSMDDIAVRLGTTTPLGQVTLTPVTYEVPEIIVTDTRPIVDITRTELGGNLTAQQLRDLPTERDYRSAIAYLPQANASYLGDATNVAGSSGSENAYYIDGVNVTDPYLAVTSTRLPMNFIKELQLITAGYQAEYGRSNGGIVNVITETGGNEFRGSGFGFFTNNDFAGDVQRGPAELELRDFARYDVGVSLSGPFAKDKLWYFAAYNPTVRNENLVIPGFGAYNDEQLIHQFAGKLTWRASERTSFNLVALGDPTEHDRIGPNLLGQTPSEGLANADPFLGTWRTGGATVSFDGHHFFSDQLFLDFKAYRLDAREKAEPATDVGWNEPQLTSNFTGLWSGGYQNIFDHHSIRTAASVVATAYAANHEVKLGLEYEDNKLETMWRWQTPDGDPGWVIQAAESLFFSNLFFQDVDIKVRVPSVFLQDSWQATDRLRLNVGVRWDGYYSIDDDGSVVEQINDQYQPRIGATYQFGDRSSQKVFASYGRFYEQIPTFAGRFLANGYQVQIRYTENPVENPAAVGDTLYVRKEGDAIPADDLKGQHFDEYVLGYERAVGGAWKVGVSGMHRETREVVDDAADGGDNSAPWRRGNPGRGALSFIDAPVRRYTALELNVTTSTPTYTLGSSYVLSRSYGNYVGVFNTDYGASNANTGPAFTIPLLMKDAEGVLPNDRTHVFKLFGSYALNWGLGMGAFFTWQSGTPLSEYGRFGGSPFRLVHQRERGTNGRTPSIWDLNLRFSYALGAQTPDRRFTPRLLLDIFHLFSQEEPVNYDQLHYLVVDANGDPVLSEGVNPYYLQPTAWQPPMTVRLGLETGF